MKTIIATLILIFICAAGTISTGQEMPLEEEAYVDDIPFNTELIAYQSLVNDMISHDIESYVDDIPFNTKKIYYESLANNMAVASADEAYADDIPFCTHNIYCMNKPCAMSQAPSAINNFSRINNIIKSIYNGEEIMYYQLDSKKGNYLTSEYQLESLLAD